MAKGRKLTTSRSEGLLGSYSYDSSGTDSSELGEEDVWGRVDDVETDRENSLAFEGITRERHVGGLSLAFEDQGRMTSTGRVVHQFRGKDSVASPRGRQMATSAPMNVPDWSKILRVDSVESLRELDESWEERDSEMVPPHEYLARSRKMNANSVFVGVGRTLKGRDLRRVRDAVWSQTGFDG